MRGPLLPIDLSELHRSANALVEDMLKLELLVPACKRISTAFRLNPEFADSWLRKKEVETYFSLLAWK
jgi:hypothetical protein